MKIANPSTRPTARGVGRPKGVGRLVERLIGVVGVSVLKENDLHVVPGKLLRDLADVLPLPEEDAAGENDGEEAAG